MKMTIEAIIESICNPVGRFKTLSNIFPVTEEHGAPKVSYSSKSLAFVVRRKGVEHMMHVYPSSDSARQQNLEQMAKLLDKMGNPLFAKFSYHSQELLVIDNECGAGYCDVSLTLSPKGSPLSLYITECCGSGDGAALKLVLREFCDSAAGLINSGVVHGRVNLRNIRVTDSGALKMVNFDHMHRAEQGEPNDNQDIAHIAIYLKIFSDSPDLYPTLSRWPVSKIVDATRCADMKSNLQNNGKFIAALQNLAASKEVLFVDLEKLSQTKLQDSASTIIDLNNWNSKSYDVIDQAEEGLRRVELDGKCGFIDEHGNEVIKLRYDNVNSFKEGRAEVFVDDCWGLINKDGVELLPTIYESVDWWYEEGLVKICMDGKYGLVDRQLRTIAPMQYDWMGEVSEGLICVVADSKHGYINCKGEEVIELQYDDAGEFRGGVAKVTKAGTIIYVDRCGGEV